MEETPIYVDPNTEINPVTSIIRVLHLDDEEQQQMFLKVFIEGDPNIKVTSARNAQDALELVQTGAYDCLVSDYDMPDMNGITLAKKIRETSDIPIIIYTGRGSEEVAEKAYSVGINDYIRKENHPAHYQVLAKRIRHAVEKRRGEEEVIRLATFPRLNPNPIVEVDLTGKIHYMNPAARREFPDLFMSEAIGSLALNWREIVSLLNIPEKTLTRDIKIREVWYSLSLHLVHGSDRLRFYASNINERKRGEEALRESEERYRALVDNSPNAISVTVGDKIVYANHSRAILAGVNDPSKLIGRSIRFQVSQEDKEAMIKRRRLRERGEKLSSPFTFRFMDNDGGVRDVIDYSSEIVYGGEKAVQHMLMDITEHKRYEERLEALHRNELELSIAETLNDVAELTLNTMENTLGFVRGGFGFVEGDMLHFSHVRGVDGVVDLPLSHRGISVRAVKTGETQFVADIRNDDDYVDGDVNGRLETLSEIDVPVKVRGDVAAVLNVESERLNAYTSEDEKLLEIFSEHVASAISRINQIQVIREAEETYSKLLDSSMELVALVSGTTITYLNKWSVEKLGYESPNDLIGEDITKVIAQEKLAEIRDRALSRQRGEPQPTRYELLLKAKSGRVVSVDASFSIITQQGKSQILVIGRDISSMKRQSRQLAALHRHATRLAEARTKEEIISATLDAAESVVGYHFLSILEPVEDALVITSSRGYHTRTLRLPLDGKGLTVRAAREKRSILTYDTLTDPNYVRGAADSRSELDVPVIVNGEIVAVINVESMEINAFDEVDKTLMETLALHVASALQRRLPTKKLPKSKTRESKNQQ